MYLPDCPSTAPCATSDAELLQLFRKWGRCSKVALRRALALLPEIIDRGLYKRFAATPHDFAIQRLGVTREVVDRIVALFKRIGHMPDLWDLLRSGEEGWSKLEIAARIATPENSRWLAGVVKKASSSELAEFVRKHLLHEKAAVSGPPAIRESLTFDSSAVAPGMFGSSATLPRMPEDAGLAEGPGDGAVRAPASDDAGSPALSRGPLGARIVATAAEAACGSLPELAACAGPIGDLESRSAPAGTKQDELFAGVWDETCDDDTSLTTAIAGGRAEMRGITVYLRREDEDLLRAWQAQVQRARRQVVPLGEIVGMLLRGELSPREAPRAQESPHPVPGICCARDLDLAPTSRESAAEEPPEGQGSLRGNPSPRVPISPPRRVEVVVRGAVPEAWTRKLVGVLPSGIAEAFKAERGPEDLRDLFLGAVEASQRCSGDRIPFAVRKFVALRAGFRCETGGCAEPICDLDHEVPRAEGGDHHPDNVRARCRRHHRMRHKGLYADAERGQVAQPGLPERANSANRAFQAISARLRT